MKTLASLLFLIVIALNISCTTNTETIKEVNNYSLESVDTLTISINDSTINTGDIFFCDIPEGRFIYTIENFDNLYQCYFYNIDMNPSLNFVTTLEKSGPNGVGEIVSSLYIKSLDSIYAANHNSQILLLDSSGIVKNKYFMELAENILRPLAYNSSPIVLLGDKLYMGLVVSNHVNSPEYYNRVLDISFDLKSQEISENVARYPDFMRKGNFFGVSSWNFSRQKVSDNKWAYSFLYDPNLYIYTDDSLISKINCPVKNVYNKNLDPVEPNAPMEKQINYYLTHTQYQGVFYDEHTKFTYRVIFEGLDEDKALGAKWWDKSFVIQIFDEEYNCLGSSKFPGMKYNPLTMFISKEGLFIPYHNKSNFDSPEDKFIFHVFKPRQKAI